MEQSRENYESLVGAAETSEYLDNPRRYDHLGIEGQILRFDRLVSKSFGLDKPAKEKLKQYMDEGRAEATELNKEYDRLKSEVLRAHQDFKEYATAHADVVNEQTPGWQQLKQRVEQAVQNLEEFQTSKLGMTFEEESKVA